MSIMSNGSDDYSRYRSFAERYVVERAGTFRVGYEQEDAWKAQQDALSIYNSIDNIATRQYGNPATPQQIYKEAAQQFSAAAQLMNLPQLLTSRMPPKK
jgi:hypothetical protein